MTPELYSKILIARYSPQNRCTVSEGEVLIVTPRASVPLKSSVAHYFVGAADHSRKSQYGWVGSSDPLSLDDFVRKHLLGLAVDGEWRDHLRNMLQSIRGLSDGVPVAATYVRRGLEQPRMELSVHRVFFHR
jgi:hypothetical protein